MGLLPRLVKMSLAVTTLVALTSLPVPLDDGITGSAFTPRIAWAGGSPDETLNPPPVPPPETKKAAAFRSVPTSNGDASRLDATRATTLRGLTLFERFGLAFRMFLVRY